VSGTLTPDATGGYHEQGTHNGYPSYRRHPAGHWLWAVPGGANKFISPAPDDTTSPMWARSGTWNGTYAPQNGAVGTATVASPP
jgi:hypothetical protein